jgi:hypothetical protein
MMLFLLLPIFVYLTNAEYNDELVRKKFYPLAAGAYDDDPTSCLKNAFGPMTQVSIEVRFV